MKVKELIDKLSQYDPEVEVLLGAEGVWHECGEVGLEKHMVRGTFVLIAEPGWGFLSELPIRGETK